MLKKSDLVLIYHLNQFDLFFYTLDCETSVWVMVFQEH